MKTVEIDKIGAKKVNKKNQELLKIVKISAHLKYFEIKTSSIG